MKQEMLETLKELEVAAEKYGRLKERSRILDGLLKTELPVGVWTAIRNILCQDES